MGSQGTSRRTIDTIRRTKGELYIAEPKKISESLLTSISCRMVLKAMRHVPDISLNLILTGRLDDEGYNGSFHNGI